MHYNKSSLLRLFKLRGPRMQQILFCRSERIWAKKDLWCLSSLGHPKKFHAFVIVFCRIWLSIFLLKYSSPDSVIWGRDRILEERRWCYSQVTGESIQRRCWSIGDIWIFKFFVRHPNYSTREVVGWGTSSFLAFCCRCDCWYLSTWWCYCITVKKRNSIFKVSRTSGFGTYCLWVSLVFYIYALSWKRLICGRRVSKVDQPRRVEKGWRSINGDESYWSFFIKNADIDFIKKGMRIMKYDGSAYQMLTRY